MKNKLLYWLMAILGFSALSSCDDSNNGSNLCEYGTPHVKFSVKGNVTDEESNPVKGVKVEFFYEEGEDTGDGGSALTDNNGEYAISDPYMWPPGANGTVVRVVATDIDGEENGLFKAAEQLITVYDSDFSGGSGSWYEGEATKTVNFILKEKEPEAEE